VLDLGVLSLASVLVWLWPPQVEMSVYVMELWLWLAGGG
jgi:hypothetical protein